MREYVIMTDSCCDLPPELAAELQLTVLPLYFYFAGQGRYNFLDNREMDPMAFYNQLRSGMMSTTSAVNVGMFQAKMSQIVSTGRDILCISFSSGLSTTYQSASIAAKAVMEEHKTSTIKVVDSAAASLGQGLLVYLAAQEKQKGKSLEEAAEFVEQTKQHLCHWFTVDDLNHLKRGGRVSAAAALVGTMLQMKPVLHVDDEGHLIPMSKVRGRKASIAALAEKLDELAEDTDTVFISHGDCEEDAKTLESMIRQKHPVKTCVINYVGPVIGSHSGPGTLALFFLGKHK